MDWQAICTSVTAAGVISTSVCYVFKRSFDKALELQFEKIKEKDKAIISEEVRRTAFMYDKQYETLKLSLSLVYIANCNWM